MERPTSALHLSRITLDLRQLRAEEVGHHASTPVIAFDQHAATTVAAVLLPGQRTPALHDEFLIIGTLTKHQDSTIEVEKNNTGKTVPFRLDKQTAIRRQRGGRCAVAIPLPRRSRNRDRLREEPCEDDATQARRVIPASPILDPLHFD